MKILLVGEYSRLHNSLKEGLLELGHQVTLISTGDYFKNFPSDIKLKRKYESGLLKKIKVGLYLLFNIDIASISILNQFLKHANQLKGYDVVQFINESPFNIHPTEEKKIISFLKKHNKKLFLLSCGTDVISVNYALQGSLRYSIFEFYKKNKVHEKYFSALKYRSKAHKELHTFIYDRIIGVIASDMDYHIPLQKHPKYLGLIPNPVNFNNFPETINPDVTKIVIFLGINRSNYHTKGIRFFEEALEIIKKKYSHKIRVEIVENLPYAEYIHKNNEAHIVLDQVLSYDQGYNALEAMAKGKVVFTGAEQEWLDFYKLKENTVVINALPDAEKIAQKLEWLIENPEKIIEISKNARDFIEREHHIKKISQYYIEVWQKNKSLD